MEEDRPFVDPNEGCSEGGWVFQQPPAPTDMPERARSQLQDLCTCAESQMVLPADPKMLKTIEEVMDELLATACIPDRRNRPCVPFSEHESVARGKLAKLGLNQFQINRVIEYELRTRLKKLEPSPSKQTGNLVYEAMKKVKRQRKSHVAKYS